MGLKELYDHGLTDCLHYSTRVTHCRLICTSYPSMRHHPNVIVSHLHHRHRHHQMLSILIHTPRGYARRVEQRLRTSSRTFESLLLIGHKSVLTSMPHDRSCTCT